MSALDSIVAFTFRVRQYPTDDPRHLKGHEMHIEVTTPGGEKLSSRSIISADIPPDVSALDWLIRRAGEALKQAMREERDGV
jgi:hypothetical protein